MRRFSGALPAPPRQSARGSREDGQGIRKSEHRDDRLAGFGLSAGRSAERGQYELAPAFDVLPTGQALGFQQMRVGEQAADSTRVNALSMSSLFALRGAEAIGEARRC